LRGKPSISVIDFSVRTPACSTAPAIAGLPADFLNGSGEFFGGAGDSGELLDACSVARTAATARPLASDETLAMVSAVLRIEVALSVTARSTATDGLRKASTEASIWRPRWSRALEILQYLRVKVAVAVHRLFEDLDRPRQRADLVAAFDMGNSTPSAPSATRLMVSVMAESGRAIERAMISTPMTTTISANRRAGQHKGQRAVRIGLLREFLAAFGIDLESASRSLFSASAPHDWHRCRPFAPCGRPISTPRRTSPAEVE